MSEHQIDIADMQCWGFPYGSSQVEKVSRSLHEDISG